MNRLQHQSELASFKNNTRLKCEESVMSLQLIILWA